MRDDTSTRLSQRIHEGRSIGKNLTEQALRMRSMAYYSDVKARLLTLTLHSMKGSKLKLKNERDYQSKMAEELREERNFITAVLDTVGALVLVLNHKGNVERLNREFTDTFGYGQERVEGKSFKDFFKNPVDANIAHDAFLQVVRGDYPTRYSNYIETESGDRRFVEWNNTAITGPDGEIQFVIVTGVDRTFGKQSEDKLRQFKATMDNTLDAVFIFDPVTLKFIYTNRGAAQLAGMEQEEFEGKTAVELQAGMPENEFVQLLSDIAALPPHSKTLETVMKKKNGHSFPVEVFIQYQKNDAGGDSFIAVVRDITERKQAEEHLKMTSIVFENTIEGIMITDANGVIQSVNPSFSDLTGYRAEEVVGKKPNILKSGRHDADFYRAMWNSVNLTGKWQGEIWNRRKNGEVYPEWLSLSAIKDSSSAVTRYMGVFNDIGERKRREDMIHHMAYHDPLTGLPNRQLFFDILNLEIAHASREGNKIAVMFLDLDKLKTVNDTHGHDIGDKLLQEAAKRISSALRQSDTVSRLAGDEFTILLPRVLTVDDAYNIAKKMLDALKPSAIIEGHKLTTTASIGISFFPDHGKDSETLVKCADDAMYYVKKRGGSRFMLYDPMVEEAQPKDKTGG